MAAWGLPTRLEAWGDVGNAQASSLKPQGTMGATVYIAQAG